MGLSVTLFCVSVSLCRSFSLTACLTVCLLPVPRLLRIPGPVQKPGSKEPSQVDPRDTGFGLSVCFSASVL